MSAVQWITFNGKMRRKLIKFLILFDNTSLLYFPGQFLSGRVLIELQDDTPALGKTSNEFRFSHKFLKANEGC